MIRTLLSPMLLATLIGLGSTDSTAQTDDLWSDPDFQKKFTGSFAFNSDIEPEIDDEVRKQLQDVVPLLETGDHEAAIDAINEIYTVDANPVIEFTLANEYFQAGRSNEAVKHYRLAVDKFPSYRRAHKNLGLALIREGRLEEAVEPLSRVVELGGNDALTYGLLGAALLSTEQYVPAESAYRNARLLEPDNLQWKLGLTQAVLRQQKYGEAIALTDELIRENPDKAQYWMLQANAYIGMNKPLEAAKNYEIVDRMGQADAPALNTLGDIYINESLWELALRAYSRSIEVDPEQEVDRPIRSVELLAQRDALEQARQLMASVKQTFAGRMGDEQRKKLLKLEARMAMAEGRGSADSVRVLEEIVTLDPLDGEALMLLGRHYAGSGEPERAIFYYERAEGIEEYEADARIRHAQLLVEASQYGEAVPLLKRAQEIRPREEVARYLEQVERIARSRN